MHILNDSFCADTILADAWLGFVYRKNIVGIVLNIAFPIQSNS